MSDRGPREAYKINPLFWVSAMDKSARQGLPPVGTLVSLTQHHRTERATRRAHLPSERASRGVG